MVDVTYELSDLVTSNNAQESARLAPMNRQSGNDDGRSVDSDEHEDKPAWRAVWDFRDLQDSGR